MCILGTGAALLLLGTHRNRIEHIVLISIDTCRSDHLSCYGHERPTTPNIDALARTSTRFNTVLSPVPITLPAHSSMLTGMIPPAHGVHNNIGYRLDETKTTLPEILRKQGFKTAAIVSSYVLNRELGLAQGFDLYDDTFKQLEHGRYGNEKRADETTQLAVNWLNNHFKEPFFLFLS